MRKVTSMAVGLMMGAMAFVASPALAGYEATDTMLDQADHSTFAGINWLSIGAAADENPSYGNGTIVVPYVGAYAGGCATNVVDLNNQAISTSYNCAAGVSILDPYQMQDMFTAVTEGVVTKTLGAQGIAQYLDSLYVSSTDPNTPTTAIDQTLDQDLADLTAGGGAYGIWQRLHQSFDRTGTEGACTTCMIGLDQTMEAVLQEESGMLSGPSFTASGVIPGVVVSYLGQWFQAGADNQAAASHTEWGGHGTVSNTVNTGADAVPVHDP